MTRLYRWKSGTAALMSMAITTGAIAPLFASAPASAQYNINQSRTVNIPANVTFPVTYEKEKVIVKPGERMDLTLKIASDIIDNNRNVLIPRGTDVVGRLEPVNLGSVYSSDRNNNNNRQGVRFVAQELVFASGRRQQISASSRTYSQVEKISKGADTGSILTDAAIGAGAATLISLVTGNRKIEVLEPIIGAAAGAGASVLLRKNQADVFVLRPEEDLDITLNSRLLLSRY
ncbi:conjugal transfer protein TrbI [Calothrix sp. FACHB-156]|nr:conjugal transfer protein TrbI [Calothrix sp. FACHB-156]